MKKANAFLQEHEDIYKKNKATEWKIQQWINQTEVCVHWPLKCCSFCANHRYYETVNETVWEHKSTASVSINSTTLLNHLWGLD